MSNSTSILDYLGRGTHAARPVSPPIGAGALAIYCETDTGNTFAWNGSAWVQLNGSAGSTTLSGDSDVAISSPTNGQLLTYNSGTGKWTNQSAAGAGGEASPPFGIVQCQTMNSPTSNAFNFQQTATAGNTLILLACSDYADTYTTPTGYTSMFSVKQSNYAQIVGFIKATAAGTETSLTLTGASNTPTLTFLEIAGSHALDQFATTGLTPAGPNTNGAWIKPPAITPVSGAMVFALSGYAQQQAASPNDVMVGPNWIGIGTPAGSGAYRHLSAFLYLGSGAGASLQPPLVTTSPQFSSGGLVAATFSIH